MCSALRMTVIRRYVSDVGVLLRKVCFVQDYFNVCC